MATRPKPLKESPEPPQTHVAAAEKVADDLGLPEGATVGVAPSEGVWDALVDADGNNVEVDGKPVRVPIPSAYVAEPDDSDESPSH